MSKFAWHGLIIGALSFSGALAWAGPDSTRSLTLEEAVQMALSNNLDIEIQRLNPRIEGQRVKFARGEFDPRVTISALFEDIERPQNTQEFVATGGTDPDRRVDTPRVFDEDNFRLNARIEGKTPWIGTSYELFTESNTLDNSLNRQLPPSLFNPEYDTQTGIRLRQPLLRDFGPGAAQAEIRIARANEKIATLAWRAQVNEIISNVIKSYYDMLFAREDLEVKSDAIGLAGTLRTENARRLELGTMSPIDVSQAEAAIATRKEDALTSRSFLSERQNALKLLILNDPVQAAEVKFVPVEPPGLPSVDRQHAPLMAVALENRPDYLQTIKQLEREQIRLKFAENQVWPRLDLEATAALNGLDGGFGDSYGRAFSAQGPQYAVGVTFSMPLGNTQARASRNIATLQKQQALLAVKRAELQISLEIATVLDRLANIEERIGTARESQKFASDTLETELKRLDQGLSTSFNVLEAQRDVAQARSRVLAARTDFQKSVVDLWLVTGTLLERQGIMFASGK